MSTLIAISGLGFVCLLLEILNLRKILVPIILLGLIGILGMTISEYCLEQSFIGSDGYSMIVSTPFSTAFSCLFIVLAIFVVAMSPKFYEDTITKIADYISVKIFMLAGAVAMVSFGNMAMFFLGLEVLSIAAYVLASSFPKDKRSNEAGMKYFIMGAFASSFILFGIALIYGATATFDTAAISHILAMSEMQPLQMETWFNVGFIMIIVGLLFKASIFPFHFWAPDVYEGSPSLVTAIMSTLVKIAALATLFKMVTIMSGAITPAFEIAIIILAILTMTVGNITGLRQKNIKRMMAFSGISHAGFMLMSLLAFDTSANDLLYYGAAYSFAAIAAFAVIIIVCQGKGNEDIGNFEGLMRKQPFLAVILSCAMLSMGGIPIFSGFFAKFFMFDQMLQANHLILVIFGVINSIIAIYYYFGVINVMLTKTAEDNRMKPEVIVVPLSYKVVAITAIVLNILLGICPSVILGLNM